FLDEEPADPYRLLWWYLALEKLDPEVAKAALQTYQANYGSDDWAWDIVNVYLGTVKSEQLLKRIAEESESNQEQAERLCEAYFYLAKQAQRDDDAELAATYFKLALATNVYDFVEHRYSLLEMDMAEEDEQPEL